MSFTLSPRCSGWAAALATVLLWSGFFLSLRLGAEEKLPPQALALLRFGIPALLLLPYYWRHRTRLHSVPLRWQLAMLAGAGLPFFWLGATGMQLAPVAQGSALIPGKAPSWSACWACCCGANLAPPNGAAGSPSSPWPRRPCC